MCWKVCTCKIPFKLIWKSLLIFVHLAVGCEVVVKKSSDFYHVYGSLYWCKIPRLEWLCVTLGVKVFCMLQVMLPASEVVYTYVVRYSVVNFKTGKLKDDGTVGHLYKVVGECVECWDCHETSFWYKCILDQVLLHLWHQYGPSLLASFCLDIVLISRLVSLRGENSPSSLHTERHLLTKCVCLCIIRNVLVVWYVCSTHLFP